MPIQIAGRINPIQLNPLEYKPTVITPKEVDYSILQNSLNKIEERRSNYGKANVAMNTALGKVREQLHNDKETEKWFTDYSNKVQNDIMNAASVGDYDEAMFRANKWAADASNNPQIINRIKANTRYKEVDKVQKQRLANHEISDVKYRWWKATNPYTYGDDYDANGNLTGAFNEMKYNTPLADINYQDIAVKAFQAVSPRRSGATTTRGSEYENTGEQLIDATGKVDAKNAEASIANGNVLGGKTYTTAGSTQTTNSLQREVVRASQIMSNIKDTIKNNADLSAAAYQDLQVADWDLKDKQTQLESLLSEQSTDTTNREILQGQINGLKKQIADIKENCYVNGVPDLDKWIEHKCRGYVANLAYNNVTTSNSVITSHTNRFGYSGSGGSNGNGSNSNNGAGVNNGTNNTNAGGSNQDADGPDVEGDGKNPDIETKKVAKYISRVFGWSTN